MSKILWFDCETTGLDSKINSIVQFGALVEIDGEIDKEISVQVKPFEDDVIDDEALAIHGLDINEGIRQRAFYRRLCRTLGCYVNKYGKKDKFVLAGYNLPFDTGFLRALWSRCGDKYYGSWFFWPGRDVQYLVGEAILRGLRLVDYKLATVCAYYGIELEAHDALSDIKATKQLWEALKICTLN